MIFGGLGMHKNFEKDKINISVRNYLLTNQIAVFEMNRKQAHAVFLCYFTFILKNRF
jgi:hypothetical protein